MNIVETTARAIFGCSESKVTWDNLPGHIQARYHYEARAAIAAVEPLIAKAWDDGFVERGVSETEGSKAYAARAIAAALRTGSGVD